MSDAPAWSEFRARMPICRRFAYFDNAAVAPLSQPAASAIREYSQQAETLGDTVWPQWARRVEGVRQTAAELLGAEPHEIALLNSTTAGINLVSEGFPWRDGDNLVTLADEFPTNQYPWLGLQDRGVETRRVESPSSEALERIFAACDDRTRLIAVSWVGFVSGWRLDIDQLTERAHKKGILVSLDAIQGLGVFPLNVRRTPVDFLSADGHKWMLGPEGASIFFLQAEHLNLLRPLGLGWNSVVGRMDYATIDLKIRPEAARYEGGSQNMPGVLGLGASLDLLREHGLGPDASAVAERVLQITDYAVEQLLSVGATIVSQRSPGHSSGIVSFEIPGKNPSAIRQTCLDADIVLSCRNGRLRISPHAYNDKSDIDRLIEILRLLE